MARVTPLLILREAREHIETAWCKGDYHVVRSRVNQVKLGVSRKEKIKDWLTGKDFTLYRSNKSELAATAANKEVARELLLSNKFQVCSVGAIHVSRILVNGIAPNKRALYKDTATTNALRALAWAISGKAVSKTGDATDKIIKFNDQHRTTRKDVLAAFDKAITALEKGRHATVYGRKKAGRKA